MGIGAIFKELEFDGEMSGDYGLYISGEGAYNAPERDVEMVTIPGRNGALALDHGRFENIEVTYPAGVFGTDEADFADKVGAIRAWLCSKKGYVRLTDEYNPDEFRLAIYKSGLEVSPAKLMAGEFDLVFQCMPQRFLKSGENAVTIASSGDTLTNPTLFNARPLLMVTGYGKIGLNGDEVEIISAPIGRTPLLINYRQTKGAATNVSFGVTPNYANMNSGDNVEILNGTLNVNFSGIIRDIQNFSQTGDFVRSATGLHTSTLIFNVSNFEYQYGTAKTASASVQVSVRTGNSTRSATITVSLSISASGVITVNVSTRGLGADSFRLSFPQIYGYSTKSALGDPVYIDLDIGEAYLIENGEMVGVNSAVNIGAELPELHPGANEITFENTITNLDIVPRWWTV